MLIIVILSIFLVICISLGLVRQKTISNTQSNIVNISNNYDYSESDLQLKFNLLNKKLIENYKLIEKKNKTIKFYRGIGSLIELLFIGITGYLIFTYTKVIKFQTSTNYIDCFIYIGGVSILVISFLALLFIIPSFKDITFIDVDNTHCKAIHQLLADTLKVPIITIEYKLNAFIHGMKTKQGLYIINEFYTNYQQFELVYNQISKNIKKEIINETLLDLKVEKSQLDVEHKQLENEGLKIDNDIKNFWECKYCSSANYGNEKKCSSCGATRLVIKLKSRNEV